MKKKKLVYFKRQKQNPVPDSTLILLLFPLPSWIQLSWMMIILENCAVREISVFWLSTPLLPLHCVKVYPTSSLGIHQSVSQSVSSVTQLCPTVWTPWTARLPCPSPTAGACSNSCPLSRWCHLIISSSVITFSYWLPSFPVSGSFPMSQFFTSADQSIRTSASTSVLPMIVRTDFLSDWLVWFPCSPGDSQESSPTPQFKRIWHSAFFMVQLSHLYMTIRKTIALSRWTFVGKVMCLLFNMLSMLVIAFLPRRKRLLISWLQSPSAVIFEPKNIIKSLTVSIVSPSIGHEVMGSDVRILVFLNVEF